MTTKSAGKTKDMTTVILGGTLTGEKLRALVILPGKGKKALKTIIPPNISIFFREDGSWVDRTVMKAFIKNIIEPWIANLPLGKRGLLLLDNCRGHFDPEIEELLKKLRIDIKLLPPNTTGRLQPLDLSTIAPFKVILRELVGRLRFFSKGR